MGTEEAVQTYIIVEMDTPSILSVMTTQSIIKTTTMQEGQLQVLPALHQNAGSRISQTAN